MAQVTVKNLTKTYSSKVTPVTGINFTVPSGGFLTLLGPSGCGKSTLLRMVAGLESVTNGDIFIDDRRVNDLHPSDRDIAMVFQSYALYPHMTVFENIAIHLQLKRVQSNEIKKRVDEIAALLDLTSLLNRKPKALSGGQRQRVALGRAIIRKPKVFLLDEPLANLDAVLREKMQTELKTLFTDLKTTVIYVTHDQIEAMAMSTQIAVLHQSKIQQIGTPDQIYTEPTNTYVASFVGSPRINIFSCQIAKDGLLFGDQLLQVDKKILAKLSTYNDVLVGIRPEHITMGEGTLIASVRLSQLVGPFSVIELLVGNLSIRALTRRNFEFSDTIRIRLDNTHLHFFDPKTKERL